MKRSRKTINALVILSSLLILNLSTMCFKVTAAEEISVGLSRDNGSENNGNISGTFTLKAKGTDIIVKIAAFFNDTQMAINETGNILRFQFYTGDYAVAQFNITVKGWDANGNVYQKTLIRNFEEPTPTWVIILIFIGIGIVVIIGIIIAYKRQKKQAKAPAPTKDDVKIDLDKELL
jgi:hypothetical protein